MILFEVVRYKNLLSTGNIFTEIKLNANRTTLISAKNGEGKSTLLDAITFALYGKPFRKINKPQLVNSINQKGLLVEIEFSIGGVKYLIRRGMKPNIFEIIKNGVLLNQDSANRDYQQYLEQNILKINYKSFTQIVILGSATYIPFMDLAAASRREVIEDLLDIQIFSTMNLLLRDNMAENKVGITEKTHILEILKTKQESAIEHNEALRNLKKIEVNKIKEKVGEYLNSINKNQEEIDLIENEIQVLIEQIEDKSSIKTKLNKVSNLVGEISAKRRLLAKDLSFYHDNDSCPVCKQGIEHNFKSDMIYTKKESMNELDFGIEKAEEKLKEYNLRLSEISEVEDNIRLLSTRVGVLRSEINMMKSALKQQRKELDSAKEEASEIDDAKIKEFEAKIEETHGQLKSLHEEKEIMSVVYTILKDGGIKTKIVKQYIPIMNKLINKYLASFDMFVDFQLDENFNEVIKSRHRDSFTYSSFSEGEKTRINLAILMTWRAISKMRNSVSTNLLLMDEILDGSVDEVGIETLIGILNNLNVSDNIFVISHRGDQFGDKFDHHIKFIKEKNFSRVVA
jgi:DNA repair exonuclease SbcCD ATPase subunit